MGPVSFLCGYKKVGELLSLEAGGLRGTGGGFQGFSLPGLAPVALIKRYPRNLTGEPMVLYHSLQDGMVGLDKTGKKVTK